MFKKNLRLLVVFFALMTPVTVFFQNCSQPGSLNAGGGEFAKLEGGGIEENLPETNLPGTGDLVIGLPSEIDTEQVPGVVAADMGVSDGSSSNKDPGASSQAGSGEESGNSNSGVVSNQGETQGTSGGEASGGSGSAVTSAGEDNDHESSGLHCKKIRVADVKLRIKKVKHSCSGGKAKSEEEFRVLENDLDISKDRVELRVEALEDEELKEVLIQLSEDGHQLLTELGQVFDLKTPSAQTSGLKIKLAETIKVKKGHRYKLKFSYKSSEQIVGAGKKCILKPVFREARLEKEEPSSDEASEKRENHIQVERERKRR